MTDKTPRVWIITFAAIMLPVVAISQGHIESLRIGDTTGNVPITQMNGRNYVEVEALARLANGALSYSGNQMTLTLRAAGNTTAQAAPSTNRVANSGFSSDFLRAGIEAMSTMREWHSALASAIENGYPVTREGLAPYQGRATTNLRLAQVAATTEADHKLAQLAANAYQKMKELSDKYVANRSNMNYSAPDSLQNDPVDQSLIACGKELGAMAASGEITDDTACH